jgi:C-terminal processing protease CtpA/Prc
VSVALASEEGAAYRAGLRVGDEIVSIAGRPATEFASSDALPALVEHSSSIHFEIRRGGEPKAFDVTPLELVR